MINPRKVQTWHQRFFDRACGRKIYRTGFQLGQMDRFSRKTSRTATEAEEYGARVIVRWVRLYDAAVVAMINKEPTI
jgi:hypothetical protein